MGRNLLSAIALSLALTAIAFAQHEQHSSSDKPARLMAGLSDLHHPVSTKNPEAQKFFNQGLALIYAFNHEEARRSFEQAARLDPKLAMAQWGIALAVGPNYNEPQIDPARLSAARRALEKADELAAGASEKERDYIAALIKRFHIPDDLKKSAMDYSHNLHFQVESYNCMGRYAEAKRAATQLTDNVRGHLKDMPMLEGFRPSTFFVDLRFNRWDDVLNLPAPEKGAPITGALLCYARGVAFAAKGKVAEAENERRLFSSALNSVSGETPFGLNTAASIFKIAEHVVDARIAAAKGDRRAAVEHWRKAMAAQDDLNYDEPPGWYYPVRESLGAALLMAGDAVEAESVFRKNLEDNPRNGRSLFGLAESLKRQGKTQDERRARAEFEKAWKNADVKLKIEDL